MALKNSVSIDKNHYSRLIEAIDSKCLESYNSRSRVHALKMLTAEDRRLFVKRDDELSFSISGSKLRKYLSLVPFLKEKKIEEAILIGGPNSNNVLGLAQLLIENGMKPIPMLRKPAGDSKGVNALFLEMLVGKESLVWVDRTNWSHVEEEASKLCGNKGIVIPEGAALAEALPGALTLSVDIVRNEIENTLLFDHIFVDAGTGLQAMALILGHSWMKCAAHLHVVLLADEEEVFREKLHRFHREFDLLVGEKTSFPTNFSLYPSTLAPSFGSVNRGVIAEVAAIAKGEGFFVDPIYSAKLFSTAKALIRHNNITGNILLVHSGGALSLAGFQSKFSRR